MTTGAIVLACGVVFIWGASERDVEEMSGSRPGGKERLAGQPYTR